MEKIDELITLVHALHRTFQFIAACEIFYKLYTLLFLYNSLMSDTEEKLSSLNAIHLSSSNVSCTGCCPIIFSLAEYCNFWTDGNVYSSFWAGPSPPTIFLVNSKFAQRLCRSLLWNNTVQKSMYGFATNLKTLRTSIEIWINVFFREIMLMVTICWKKYVTQNNQHFLCLTNVKLI